ncbi:DEHA2E02574p [Debaryomyces hansenii CBS767]|uniref:DEHA2E02574p n=1 Tax=Debaryomyces hansenii (strain ATCC 36239 / CBS 767 / BCRC 21394 / JCM 1990 / NBRC 0083 / IGC 2968) TaxID=284592 RepID=Q6BQS9_DEBHA|nr:DEHA2E02574p [Debaryomyces hansenii CBS767]CAG87657.1 DEHA2E02574p [Debaryomyces hansenii CBS767]|eukprot:XP_459441.1 DEHA2E02574p [Debaryomyces hansenii CBS767]
MLQMVGKISAVKSHFTNILIIGGSYGGITSVKIIRDLLKTRQTEDKLKRGDEKFKITMIEPKEGFLNLIAIPRTLVDMDFARTQYFKYTDIGGLGIHKVIDANGNIKATNNEEDKNDLFEITCIQGKVLNVGEKEANFTINGDESRNIKFDYVILASGRDRNYPVTPAGRTKKEFLNEMKEFYDRITDEKIKTISIIGAGAVGIELSGEIKHYFPNKHVNLIHPHDSFPPEPLSGELKQRVKESLERANIDIHYDTRIQKELENGDLLTTTGSVIISDLNYWSTSKYNNIKIVDKYLRSDFLLPDSTLKVNDMLQLSNGEKTIPNFFCIGDIASLPIIKTAGWALFMASIVGKNIISNLFEEDMKEKLPPAEKMPRGILLVGGNGDVISSNNGIVELNNPEYVEAYKDYRFSSSFKYLELDLPTEN